MRFRNQYYFLSNMYPHEIEVRGYRFTCVEAAFQAMKCKTTEEVEQFIGLDGFQAKKLGRKVALRKDWNDIRDGVMFRCLEEKFKDKALLSALGDIEGLIAEDNDWGDTYWGVCRGQGKNVLGRMLMQIRDR